MFKFIQELEFFWLILEILALRRQRQEDQKYKDSLGYIVSLRPDYVRFCLKQNKSQTTAIAKPKMCMKHPFL